MKRKQCRLLALILVLLIGILSSCTIQNTITEAVPSIPGTTPESSPSNKDAAPLKAHFIDVGQGDCSFIQLADGRSILIDGGNRADFPVISNYLQGQKVKKIDYLIATHPHEDHIGALPAIIKNFEIGNIYMPKAMSNTKIFEELLSSIKTKGYSINTAAAGVVMIDEADVKLAFLAPNTADYDELNNYSAVMKLTYKNTSFLFTGDAEDVSEKEMLIKNLDVKVDVLKVGHHGGRTSTTKEFLARVAPKAAVISAGKDNDYGHPHKETLDKLNAEKVQIYRTDLQGSIICSSDGSSIKIDKMPIAAAENKDVRAAYIGNINSKVFHLPSCSALPKPENKVKLSTRTDAQNAGYQPCQRCKP